MDLERNLSRVGDEGHMALRILSMERENVMDLLREKVTVVEWDPSRPLAEVLRGMRRGRR